MVKVQGVRNVRNNLFFVGNPLYAVKFRYKMTPKEFIKCRLDNLFKNYYNKLLVMPKFC